MGFNMQTQNQYVPGVCNIGENEIKIRKSAGWIALIITVILYISLVFLEAPRFWRLFIFVPATAAAIGFLQAWMHFCAYFGMRGVFNFGETGKADTVEQAGFRAKDRRKAWRIILYSAAIGIIVAVAAYYLPV